jgi:hypothetical protein
MAVMIMMDFKLDMARSRIGGFDDLWVIYEVITFGDCWFTGRKPITKHEVRIIEPA